MDGFMIKNIDGKEVPIGRPKVDIEKTLNSEYSILIKTSARGKNEEEARTASEKIVYNYEFKDSTLRLDPFFLLGESQKWRNQEVEIIIRVPEGKGVYISEDSDRLLDDVDNVTNTWDREMGGKTWVMLPEGLTMKDSIR
jgi:hypothetical protein